MSANIKLKIERICYFFMVFMFLASLGMAYFASSRMDSIHFRYLAFALQDAYVRSYLFALIAACIFLPLVVSNAGGIFQKKKKES